MSVERKGDDTRTRSTGQPAPATERTAFPYADPSHYAIRHEHARGGRGRVLAAHDRVLERPVAIKELLAPAPEAFARFEREALLTARLQHPAIVPIYEAGRWPDGEPFYAMRLVAGRSLKEAIVSATDSRARLGLLPHVITVADAIAYAHSHRIVHRDLKPANIVLGEFGETVVIDWGLAKDLAAATAEPATRAIPDDADATATGSVLGTPHFMPPEQARGESTDERADVYALGAVLYNVLAGQSPYAGPSWSDTLAQVLAGPPAPLDTSAPPELVGIVARAMAREPADRYATARELAEDLRRFQTGQLVASHRYSTWSLVRRWVRRHRVPVALSAAFVVALAAIGAISVSRIASERGAAEDRQYHLVLLQARDALARDPAAALAWLKTYPIEAGDFREVRAIFEEARGRGPLAIIPGTVGGAVAATPAGTFRWLLADGRLLELDPRTGTRRTTTLGPWPGFVECAALSPHGDRAAVVDREGISLFDVATAARRRIALPRGEVVALAWCRFTADGDALGFGLGAGLGWLHVDAGTIDVFRGPGPAWTYAASRDGALVWGGWPAHALHVVGDGRSEDWPTGDHAVTWAAIADSRIAALTDGGRLYIWSRAGALRHDVAACAGFSTAAILADRVVVHCGDGSVHAIDLETGTDEPLGTTAPNVGWVAARNGTLAVALATGAGRVWNTATGESAELVYDDAVFDGALTADNAYLAASTPASNHALVFRTPALLDRVLAARGGKAVLSPDGARLVEAGPAGTAVCDGGGGACRPLDVTASWLAFSPDGSRLGFATDTEAGWLDVASGERRVVAGAIVSAAWSPGGGRVAFSESRRRVIVVDDTGASRTLATGSLALDLSWTRDGRRLAWRDDVGTVEIVELDSDRRWRFTTDASVTGLAFSSITFTRDGRRLLGGTNGGRVWLWDLDANHGGEIATAAHALWINATAMSPDGHLAATASNDRSVHLLDLDTLEVRVLNGHSAEVTQLAFTPDGRRVISGGNDGSVRVWDVATGDVAVLHGTRPIHSLAVAPDGAHVIVGSDDRIAEWDLARLPAPLADAAAVRAALDAETTVVLGADDRALTPP